MKRLSSLLVIGFTLIAFSSELLAQDTAKVYIMRKQTIALLKPDISVNDVEIGNLPNKKYIECNVLPGPVSVTTYCYNTFVLIIANEDYTFVDNVEYAKNDDNTFKE